MLNVDSIKKGIVIDHIERGKGMLIFDYLNLDKADFTVALIMNAHSNKFGRKDLIKIENVIDLDLKSLGVIDPNTTVNIIEDEKIVEKINLSLPQEVEGLMKCKNPRCVTSQERDMVSKFVLVDEDKRDYKCIYCDHIYEWED